MAAFPLLLLASIHLAAGSSAAAYQPIGPEGAAEPQWGPQGPPIISGVRDKRSLQGPPGPPGPLGLPGGYGGGGTIRGLPGLAPCQPCINPCEVLINCRCRIDAHCVKELHSKTTTTPPPPPLPLPLLTLAAAALTTTPAAEMTITTARVPFLPCPQECQTRGENGECIEDLNCPFQAGHKSTSPTSSTVTFTEPPHNVSDTSESAPQSSSADRIQTIPFPQLLLPVTLLMAWL